jgi:tetratricopeptide (TPR) repeat protein/transcriptional regulator with XRE-family HTH domain
LVSAGPAGNRGSELREALGVAEQPGQGFAELLRQLRAEARLTQEELAEAASLSPRSVSDLERGIHRTAQKDTARLLADALGLAEPVRALFVAAARGRGPIADVLAASREAAPGAAAAAATRTLPRDTVSFTGRGGELGRLLEALTPEAADGVVLGIHAIDGMAGVGKTALAVHAAHRLAGSFPDGQFFLQLHAHTPGQRPVDPADALASLLLTAGLTAQQIPPEPEARAARWRDYVAGKKILLLLDDAAGHDQVRPLLPGTAGSLVLITSRRRLAALGDVAQISLDTLSPEDAAALLVRLSARPGIYAGDDAIGDIARLCGHLPLAIGLLASQLRNHPARTAASVAADLSAARDRLALMHAENVSVSAAFGLSYTDLTPGQQQLFRRLGLVPGPSVDAYAAAALDGTGLDTARRHLDELYDQHLVTEPAPGRYQMHDLLREHARALVAGDDPAETDKAATRLLDYYLHSATAAGQHFNWGASAIRRPPPAPPPSDAPDLSATGRAAAWLEAERVNLHAAADRAASQGRALHAVGIPAAIGSFLTMHGHWDQSAALAQTALTAARQAGDRPGEADAVTWLGTLQRETGDYPAAAASFAQAMAIYGDLSDGSGRARALNQLGFLQVLTGEYPAAAASHQQAIDIARDIGERVIEANTIITVGLLQQLTGDYPAAAASLELALAMFGDLGDLFGQAQALNCLGVVQQETGDYQAAVASQQQAMALFREFGHRLGQAYALNDLGLVQQDIADYQAAAASHRQALALFRDLGNRLGEAEALNRLGELATRTSATGQARELHTQALAIARDISAAPEEARALEGLGQSHLRDGNAEEAAAHLQQALVIYERIGAHGARRIQKTFQSQMPATATREPEPTGPDG